LGCTLIPTKGLLKSHHVSSITISIDFFITSFASATTISDNSPVGLLVRLISDAAAPLAGLSAATLAYSAAAMLPVWLPIALGRGKRSLQSDPRVDKGPKSSHKLSIDELLYKNILSNSKDENFLVRPRSFLSYGHFRGGLRRLSKNLSQKQKNGID
jgi:hypothetical protein